jgi:paraquat-inducible protein B
MKTPQQKVKSFKLNWAIWLFPCIALLISGWVFYDIYKNRGPTIEIYFDDAAGLQAEKTSVRFRGVSIGTVKSVRISKDSKEIKAIVLLQKEAEQFAVEGSQFWIVSPQVTFQGVSGLETLFEGTYISALPGADGAELKTDFKGAMSSESISALENTSVYFLETSNAESVSAGDSITFRGLVVGNVTKVSLSKSAQVAVVQINIQNKYVHLIRTHTVFWRKVGIQANLGLFSSVVKINSLDSIVRGGVEFFSPNSPGEIAKAGARYNLSAAPPKGYEKWSPNLEH